MKQTKLPSEILKSIGLLRQWLNEKPTDLWVTNEHIIEFLEKPIIENTKKTINNAIMQAYLECVGVEQCSKVLARAIATKFKMEVHKEAINRELAQLKGKK
jgi:hypothetical protein